MPTDTEIMEKIRVMQTDTALHAQSLITIQKSDDYQWNAIEKIQDSLSVVKTQISAFGVVNTLILGFIAYKLTRGI
jgi:hypothetical protein